MVEKITSSQQAIDMEARYGAHNYHPMDVVIAKGKGPFVWDVEGKKYFDFQEQSYLTTAMTHCWQKSVKKSHTFFYIVCIPHERKLFALTCHIFPLAFTTPFQRYR